MRVPTIQLRRTQARPLLEAGDFGLVAVADAVGFALVKYFHKLCAERFGRRPSAYRAQSPTHQLGRNATPIQGG